MESSLITIKYKTADGKTIFVDVSPEVAEVIEETDCKVRSQGRRDRRHLYAGEYIDGVTETIAVHTQEDIAGYVIRMDRYHQLYAAMETLTPAQRRRVRLYFFEGMTYRKIGDMEGVSHKTIHCSVVQAKEKMRKYIDE